MDSTLLIVFVLATVGVGVAVALIILKRPSPNGDEAVPRLRSMLSGMGIVIRGALGSGLRQTTWTELEEALLSADVGVEASQDAVMAVRDARPDSTQEARRVLAQALRSMTDSGERFLHLEAQPAIVLVVGVNGTGKTTTIAKLGYMLLAEDKTVLLGAADTFRAAAREQLETWGDRLGVRVVGGSEGADPASVAFDTVEAARSGGVDVVILDTAGRLHAKKNLMAELAKIHRVAGGEHGVDEVLLILDATAGQNGLAQVREFASAVPLTGIVLTKLDGTAKGGIVLAVERELGVPVKFVGLGEGLTDLVPFDPDEFVDALLGAS